MISTRIATTRTTSRRDRVAHGATSDSPLQSLLRALESHRGPLAETAMRRLLDASAITAADLREFVTFNEDCYTRNRVHIGNHHELLVLCWRNGQRSPIHDHRGSNCALKVMKGVATEITFLRSPCGLVSPSAVHELKSGEVTASRDHDMHQMGNLQASGDLITLHLYSPPLRHMGTYFLGDSIIGEHECPADGMRMARLAGQADRRAHLIEALRRTRRRIRNLAGAGK